MPTPHDPYVPCGDYDSDTLGMCIWLTGDDSYCDDHLYEVDASHASWLVDPDWGAPNFWPAFDDLMAEFMAGGPAPTTQDDADPADDVNGVDMLSVSEGEEEAIDITFEGVTEDFTIWYETAPASASPSSDYTHVEGTQSIKDTDGDGRVTKTIYVRTTEDTTAESNETFDLLVTTPFAAQPYSWPVSIMDDEPLALDAQDVGVNEPEPGETVTIEVPVALKPPQAGALTIRYSTANGTAVSPGDYAAASGSISVAPLASSVTIPITVNGDSVNELTGEYFTVWVSTDIPDPAGGSGTVTVSDTATVRIYPPVEDSPCDGSGQYGC